MSRIIDGIKLGIGFFISQLLVSAVAVAVVGAIVFGSRL